MNEAPSELRSPTAPLASPMDLGKASNFFRALWRELAADRFHYLLIGVYAAATIALAAKLGVISRLNLFVYLPVWAHAVTVTLLLYVLLIEVPRSIRAHPNAPITHLAERLPQLITARLVSGLILMLAVGLFMGIFTAAKTMLPYLVDFSWDRRFAELDAALTGGVDPWRLLHPLMGHLPVSKLVEFCYAGVWMLLVCAAPAWAAMSPRMAVHRHRFLATYFLCWIVLGNVVAGLFFSAGPAFYVHETGDAGRYADLLAYHAATPQDARSAYGVQQWLWNMQAQGKMQMGTGISAFPSLHVAMATLTMIAGFLVNRWLGLLGLAWLTLILAGSIHLAWHYAVDGYASIAGVLAIWVALRPLQRPPAAAGA